MMLELSQSRLHILSIIWFCRRNVSPVASFGSTSAAVIYGAYQVAARVASYHLYAGFDLTVLERAVLSPELAFYGALVLLMWVFQRDVQEPTHSMVRQSRPSRRHGSRGIAPFFPARWLAAVRASHSRRRHAVY
jgi:hypothetical protein